MIIASPPPRRDPPEDDEVSRVVADEIRQLNEWAGRNERDARRDQRDFWALKLPAIIGGLGASALEAFHLGWAVILAGFVTSVCVAVDGMHPRGRLYNVHKRASNDLSALQDRLASEWNRLRLLHGDKANLQQLRRAVADLLTEIQKEKEKISQYLTAAEASLGVVEKPHKG